MKQFSSFIPEEKRSIVTKMVNLMETAMSGENLEPPTSWKGYTFLPGFDATTAKHAYENYEVDDGTVFVITYPKTGTNWCGEIVRQIMYGHDAELDAISKTLPIPLYVYEGGHAEKFELMKHVPLPRKYFASNLPEELVNTEMINRKNGKIIIVMRNPKDQAVSWFHFTQKQNRSLDGVRDLFSSDWHEFLSTYTQGKQPTFSKEGEWYLDHILGWYKHKDDPNVLFVYFEDMKKELKKEIKRIAKFIEIDLTEERVAQISDGTTFSAMQREVKSKSSEADSARTKLNLMRKGQVGEWKKRFTVAQSEMMDKLIEEKLGNTDIKFTYEL